MNSLAPLEASAAIPSPELLSPDVPFRGIGAPLETATNRALSFAIGLLLAVLTIQTDYVGTPTDLLARIAPVDFICIAMLAVLFFRHSLRMPHAFGLLYVGALVLSLAPGLLNPPYEDRDVWIGISALLMALAYYFVGLNVGASRQLLVGVLAGLCIGVFVEAIIVVHDLVAARQWFPDPMEGRVRGTFKANGQLGAYGFCAAGMLLTFGVTQGPAWFRRLCLVLGVTAASFVFLASRRTGMVSVIAWGALAFVIGRRFSGRRFYKASATAFFVLMIAVAALWPQIEASFVGRRFMSAMETLGHKEGFIQNQFRDCVDTAGKWFPLGFGPGRGSEINRADGHEVHNCFLAVIVELGVLGLIGFLGIVLWPLFNHRWRTRSRQHDLLGVLLTSFLLISLLFMVHNTLVRDRTFMLFLGIATTMIGIERRMNRPSEYFPESEPDYAAARVRS